MKVHDYIKYYKESVPLDLCEAIKEYRYNYKPSTYSNNKGKVNNKIIANNFFIIYFFFFLFFVFFFSVIFASLFLNKFEFL